MSKTNKTDIIKIINSDNFKKLDQFQKRAEINDFILKEYQCSTGVNIMCFDVETYVEPKNIYFYSRYSNKKIGHMTIGKTYTIDEYRGSNKIKVTNDIGKQHWYRIGRFIYSLKIERRKKLKKINKFNENQ